VEGFQVIWQFAAQLVNARNNQFPVRSIFQSGVFANFFVVFMADQMHSENGVVVISAGKLCAGIRDQHLDQFRHVNAAFGDDLDSYSLVDVSSLHNLLVWHKTSSFGVSLAAGASIGLIYRFYS